MQNGAPIELERADSEVNNIACTYVASSPGLAKVDIIYEAEHIPNSTYFECNQDL